MSTTALNIVTGAYTKLGVYALGETLRAEHAQEGLRTLNLMMGTLSLQQLTKPVQARLVLAVTAGKGGPSNPYTVGPGGDFNIPRPAQKDLMGAGLILGGNQPASTVEIPRTILTNDDYENIRIKDLPNPLFTDIYYNATYGGGLGSLILWPVPNTALHSLALYVAVTLLNFTDLASSYDTPQGLDETLEYNLALRLAASSAKQVPPDVAGFAVSTLANYKRSNISMSYLPSDPAVTRNRQAGYNINVG